MDLIYSEGLSAQQLLESGKPFVPFSKVSVQTLQGKSDKDVSAWLEDELRWGRPFVIRGFAETDEWRKAGLNSESLADLSASEAIPVRNCQTGRDVKMRLRDLLSQTNDAGAGERRGFLYAKDLHCPQEWVRSFETILPSALRHLGSLDLFRVLPKEIAPEVLMAYVGTQNSFSGFHRCFSATIAVNLLVEAEGNSIGSICFGTDSSSQMKYDAFMEELGKSPHTDWANIPVTDLWAAGFPIYVTDQRPGDLVVFPAATAHQIWNVSPMVARVVWNIMHTTSITSFFDYVEPSYQQKCHTDTGRVSLIPLHALRSLPTGRAFLPSVEEKFLLDIFHRMVEDEDTGQDSTLINLVDTQGAVVECNFCGLTIWNRHLHCEECGDFDLCLTCFVSGRSCRHAASYTLVELIPRPRCLEIVQAAARRVGRRHSQSTKASDQRSIGAVAVAAMRDRQETGPERLCHLCRDSHPAWKGITCNECSAFFCFRGLYRHFDVDLIPFLKKGVSWRCPKCEQRCNCRCCHFRQPYESKDKPVRARIKPIDPRGRLGFVDNVFDQKRGKRASLAATLTSPQPELPARGIKRSRMSTDETEVVKTRQNGGTTSLSRAGSAARSISDARPTSHATLNGNFAAQAPTTPSRAFDPLGPFRTGGRNETRKVTPTQTSPYPYLPPPSASTTKEGTIMCPTPTRSSTEKVQENEESIHDLEKKLESLRGYADDLLELSLVDSHRTVLERISQFEAEIERKRKTDLLLSKLHSDFPDLADLAREEARRRGL
ncbi:hypothetical protein BJY04DRAFT_226923 [Aspergillus karnatakaensis]|uniref:uncharacterized protein n=1 Tax=Aspergillus karnatakaensis TaxID=1810916 RepID=UPI003CCCE0CF